MSKSIARRLAFSVTIHDCRVDTFTVGGNGGGGKDTSNTGVRVTHEASGAMGRAVDTRSQAKNKSLAFRRMAESKEFQAWARLEASRLSGTKSVETLVDEAMAPANLWVEEFDGDLWKPYDHSKAK